MKPKRTCFCLLFYYGRSSIKKEANLPRCVKLTMSTLWTNQNSLTHVMAIPSCQGYLGIWWIFKLIYLGILFMAGLIGGRLFVLYFLILSTWMIIAIKILLWLWNNRNVDSLNAHASPHNASWYDGALMSSTILIYIIVHTQKVSFVMKH